MELASKKIKEIIAQILPLLNFAEESYWENYFNHISKKLGETEHAHETIKSLSLIFKGGMGSFSDLVLHKNRKPLIEENNKLDKLKDALYEACEEALKEI